MSNRHLSSTASGAVDTPRRSRAGALLLAAVVTFMSLGVSVVFAAEDTAAPTVSAAAPSSTQSRTSAEVAGSDSAGSDSAVSDGAVSDGAVSDGAGATQDTSPILSSRIATRSSPTEAPDGVGSAPAAVPPATNPAQTTAIPRTTPPAATATATATVGVTPTVVTGPAPEPGASSIIVSTSDEFTGAPLAGAHYTVTRQRGDQAEEVIAADLVDTTGTLTVALPDSQVGDEVVIVQSAVPPGYQPPLAGQETRFLEIADGRIGVLFDNQRIATVSVRAAVGSLDGNEPPPFVPRGGYYRVALQDGTVLLPRLGPTDDDGLVSAELPGVRAGTRLVITELSPPPGLTPDDQEALTTVYGSRSTGQVRASVAFVGFDPTVPTLRTSADGSIDGSQFSRPGDTVTDELSYTALQAGEQYLATSSLMEIDADGAVTPTGMTSTTAFTPVEPSGELTTSVLLDRARPGTTLVFFESLALAADPDTVVVAHRDPDEYAQQIYLAGLTVEVTNKADGTKTVTGGDTAAVTVRYCGVQTFTLSRLQTQAFLAGQPEGTELTGSVRFTPDRSCGTRTIDVVIPETFPGADPVTLTFRTTLLAIELIDVASSADPTDPALQLTVAGTDPGSTTPDPTVPTDPGTTDPGTTDPGTTDPGTTDPSTTDPSSTTVTVPDPAGRATTTSTVAAWPPPTPPGPVAAGPATGPAPVAGRLARTGVTTAAVPAAIGLCLLGALLVIVSRRPRPRHH